MQKTACFFGFWRNFGDVNGCFGHGMKAIGTGDGLAGRKLHSLAPARLGLWLSASRNCVLPLPAARLPTKSPSHQGEREMATHPWPLRGGERRSGPERPTNDRRIGWGQPTLHPEVGGVG